MKLKILLEQQLQTLHREGRYRVFADLRRRRGFFPVAEHIAVSGSSEVTVWCSNDYLGMGQHPAVLAAMHEAIDAVGAGSGGTRNISGTTHYHVELERELADLHGKEAALLFTSAYVANDATLSTLARLVPGAVVFSDEKNHSSMIEGIRHGKCEKQIFRHNDIDDLETKLEARRLPVLNNPSHIVPVMVGCPVRCKAMTDALLHRYGIYVQPINYPTVSRGTERMRLTPSPAHSDEHIANLVHSLDELYGAMRMELARE